MDDFYKDVQAVAADVLGEFAQGTVEYVRLTPGTGPKDNPGPPVETPHAMNAAVRGVSQKYVDGSAILATDLQATLPGDGVAPDASGFMRVDGKRYKIVQVIKVPAAGTPVAFVVIFRK